jgi:hypothetical protein
LEDDMTIRCTRYALAFLGATLAVAGTSVTAVPGRADLSLVAHAAAADEAGHGAYMKRNEGKFTQWGRKIDQFNRDAARKGAAAKREAQQKLDAAWSDVKARWQDLKQAGSDGWDKAKDAYEKSERKLEQAWRDATS